MLAADLERVWCEMPLSGEVVLGRYGRFAGMVQEGELGDAGSVHRRTVGGFWGSSNSAISERLCSRSMGKGEDLKASILSVSGTGSIFECYPFLFTRLSSFYLYPLEASRMSLSRN